MRRPDAMEAMMDTGTAARFAKASKACATCLYWGGERKLSRDVMLAVTESPVQEGGCLNPASPSHQQRTRARQTCPQWKPMLLLR